MISYEDNEGTIIKNIPNGRIVLSDIAEELNGQIKLMYKMASLIRIVSLGKVNPGVIAEARDLFKEAKKGL